jgi:hypothetical protein
MEVYWMADMPALGIAVDSPQPDVGGARTWNVKPDPCGNAQIIFKNKNFIKIIINQINQKMNSFTTLKA